MVAVEEIASVVGNLATGAGSVPRPQVDMEEDCTIVLMVVGRGRAEATAINVVSQDHTIAWVCWKQGWSHSPTAPRCENRSPSPD